DLNESLTPDHHRMEGPSEHPTECPPLNLEGRSEQVIVRTSERMRAISKRRRECLRSVLLVPATPRQRETGSRDTLRLLQAQQTFPHDEEVRQGAGDDESMGVLRQAAVTDLGDAYDAFDHADRMLDFGPRPRLLAIRGRFGPAQDLLAARFALGEILRVGRTGAEHRRLPGVGGVAPHPALAAV